MNERISSHKPRYTPDIKADFFQELRDAQRILPYEFEDGLEQPLPPVTLDIARRKLEFFERILQKLHDKNDPPEPPYLLRQMGIEMTEQELEVHEQRWIESIEHLRDQAREQVRALEIIDDIERRSEGESES